MALMGQTLSPEDRLPIRSGNLRILSPRAIVRILELLQFTAAFLAVTHDSVPMILSQPAVLRLSWEALTA